MSILLRNTLNRNLDFKSLLAKLFVGQRRQLCVQCLKFKKMKSGQQTHHSKLFANILYPVTTGSHSWKWLLAISLLYAGGYQKENIYDLIKYGTVEDLTGFLKDNPKEVNKYNEYGWTPLLVAAANNKYNQIEVLLKFGADQDMSDNFLSVYHAAKKLNIHPEDVIKKRVDDFSKDFNLNGKFQGFTALHYAALFNNIEAINILIKYGADPHLKSVTGHKPIDLVTHSNTYNLFLDYEKNFELIKKKREAEDRKKFPLELRLKEKIVGQENAIKIVSSAIRRKENGWTDEEHPLVFLFLGSSGIGKTELAKQIAHYMHKNKNNFIRLDMSEYQEKHEVAKMIGSPPGYVGYDDGGLLTKQLSRNPNAVVLFDEVDKAHRDVLTILLQLFDEGRLTDGKGKTIECTNAIFVMTSNLASEEIAEHALELRKEQRENKLLDDSRLSNKKLKDKPEEMLISKKFKDNIVKPILKRHFRRDEFLGRINEIVYFLPFSEKELKTIVHRELKHWQELAMKKHKVILEWDSGVEHVIMGAYDVSYGARSIKYEVERSIVSQIAKAHEIGVIKENTVIRVVSDLTKGDYGRVFLKILHNNKFLGLDEF
ncbi:ATPase, AAA-type, core,ClpA/B family,Clp ATPase, C-terminal,P-loop containing nucleoside triphosphate [Cinara cedri]|uniref:ATPase, AAA-type, core,ClpA/B family,Clp ATPase, C-terminal,P-loop containing nucleoside triphosphate n=1 Tax=Cinara cedri TaxID=506608 RepID=A0A5E4NM00_9HEMI|nr:ATPase, AAA-type, core,ClpA/B family,Clp ATPase, C-terminal,P-loop containing nucleoside triphosphate [Cinara cedri]